MDRLRRLIHEVHRRSLWQVMSVYLVASWGSLEAVAALTESAGLPDWVPSFALVLLLLGFPIVLATALVQEGMPGSAGPEPARREPEPDPENLAAGTGSMDLPSTRPGFLARHLTWKRSLLGGVLGFALLGLVVAGYFVMWSTGVGPVGSLEAQGIFEEGERVVLAEFSDRSGAAALGPVVTEALRIDLVESPNLEPVPPDEVRQVLARMELPEDIALDMGTAREVALRGGFKAVIDGEVASAGSGFLLTATIRDAQSGRPLAAFRETAEDEGAVIGAIDKLSQRIREKAGESLRSIKSGPELESVTTSSLDALRVFTRAEEAFNRGDLDESLALLEDAVEADPEFAMAWRKIAVVNGNTGLDPEGQRQASTRAWELRERLTGVERHLAEAMYHSTVTNDRDGVVRAYEAVLRIDPDDPTALNNLANEYMADGDLDRAEELYRKAVEGPAETNTAWSNLVRVLARQKRFAEAREALARFRERYPDDDQPVSMGPRLAMLRGDPEAAEEARTALGQAPDLSLIRRVELVDVQAREALRRGRLNEAREHFRRAVEMAEPASPAFAHLRRLWWAHAEAFLGDPGRIPEMLGETREPTLVDGLPTPARNHYATAWLMALAGRPDRARELLDEWVAELDPVASPDGRADVLRLRAYMASVRGDHTAALEHLEATRNLARDPDESVLDRAWILEAAGRTGEAAALYEVAADRVFGFFEATPVYQTVAMERLGPLYEALGRNAEAAEAYRAFADAWQDADPELQSRVSLARRKAAELSPGG